MVHLPLRPSFPGGSHIKPSKTRRGRAWIKDFEGADKPTARKLADSVTIVKQDEVRSSLIALLTQAIDSHLDDGAVRDREQMSQDAIPCSVARVSPVTLP